MITTELAARTSFLRYTLYYSSQWIHRTSLDYPERRISWCLANGFKSALIRCLFTFIAFHPITRNLVWDIHLVSYGSQQVPYSLLLRRLWNAKMAIYATQHGHASDLPDLCLCCTGAGPSQELGLAGEPVLYTAFH